MKSKYPQNKQYVISVNVRWLHAVRFCHQNLLTFFFAYGTTRLDIILINYLGGLSVSTTVNVAELTDQETDCVVGFMMIIHWMSVYVIDLLSNQKYDRKS